MMPRMMRPFVNAALIFVVACGNGGGSNNDGTGGDDSPPTDASPDGFVAPESFTRLIGRSWSLMPGATDTYRCVRFTVTQDSYITNIMAQAPFGTHHTVLSIADDNT